MAADMIKASEARIVGKGETYKNRDNGEKVVVFAVTGTTVAYAPVGRSSENRLSQEDFVSQFAFDDTSPVYPSA